MGVRNHNIGFAFNRARKNHVLAHHVRTERHNQKKRAVIKKPVKHGLAHGLRGRRNGRQPPHRQRNYIHKKSQIKKRFGKIDIFGTQKFECQRTAD